MACQSGCKNPGTDSRKLRHLAQLEYLLHGIQPFLRFAHRVDPQLLTPYPNVLETNPDLLGGRTRFFLPIPATTHGIRCTADLFHHTLLVDLLHYRYLDIILDTYHTCVISNAMSMASVPAFYDVGRLPKEW